jgi:cellulase
MMSVFTIATVLSTCATSVLAHGYVSGIVTNNVYTKGWQVSYWYDIVNHVTIPQSPGWYEEALDLGFIPPDQYQYVAFTFNHIAVQVMRLLI